MEFTKKKMNKIFKLLIFILIVEISLGYLIYIKNSSLKSGHYISSIITAWVKLNRKIENITIPTQEEQTESKEINKEQTESKEINKEQTESKEINKEQPESKEIIKSSQKVKK